MSLLVAAPTGAADPEIRMDPVCGANTRVAPHTQVLQSLAGWKLWDNGGIFLDESLQALLRTFQGGLGALLAFNAFQQRLEGLV